MTPVEAEGGVVDLIPNVGAGTLLESTLLAPQRAVRIGAVQRMDYHEAVVLTHDRWKFAAGGISQFTFLLATAHDVDKGGTDDDEVLLLRVEGTAPLALESDLHAVREEALRDALSQHEDSSPGVILNLDLDPFTRNRASFTGLRWYWALSTRTTSTGASGWSSAPTWTTSTRPRPTGPEASRSGLVDHRLVPEAVIASGADGPHRGSALLGNAAAGAGGGAGRLGGRVNIHDFIGHKTGLLGMTRTGKSNTAKILVARTSVASEERRSTGQSPIGQLIFDPQGEYANDNVQDGSAIVSIHGLCPDITRERAWGARGCR